MLNPFVPEPGGAGLMRFMTQVLDEIDYGVLVLGEGGHVLHANHSARACLGAQHPLYLNGSELRTRLGKDSTRLHQALQAALHRGLRRLLTVGEGEQRAGIAIVPLTPNDVDAEPSGSATLVVLGRREVGGGLTVQGFAREHHLSTCEEGVLSALCEGFRPQEIAQRKRVKIATVRTQIANIRSKTGAESIRDLVQMVALLPPMICALRH